MSIDVIVQHDRGHNFSAWDLITPKGLDWLSQKLG